MKNKGFEIFFEDVNMIELHGNNLQYILDFL
jgi:hypothetical protein